jgi:hypothetical protein
MEDSSKATLSLRAAYSFGIEHGLAKEIAEIRDMIIEWDLSYTSSLRRGYVIELFEKQGIFDEFKTSYWAYGNTPGGERRRRRFLKLKSRYEDFLSGRESIPEEEEEEQDEDRQFAAESDLRDFLAKNPGCIEKGLHVYHSGDRDGVEFPIDGGFIDLLCVDQNNSYVVIELKVGKGRNKTIGQLLYYMGWVDKNFGNGPCRGIIIAKEIPNDLVLAVQRVPGVSLYRYNLSVSVEQVKATP